MAYKIIVKKRFKNKTVRLLYYLETQWGKPVADRFLEKMDRRIASISVQPFIGIRIKHFENVRSVLITKQNRLYYRIKENTVEIINMYDTRINPVTNSYK